MSKDYAKMTSGALVVGALVVGALVVAACEGGGAGAKCSKNSDCNTSLTCQPVQGRDSDYCCGTYGPEEPTENIPENCQPVDTDAGSGSSSSSSTSSVNTAEDASTGG
jgi:hypothetical protein